MQNIRNDLWGSQFSQIWRHPDLDIRQKSTIYVHPSIFKGKYDFPENGDENMLAVNFPTINFDDPDMRGNSYFETGSLIKPENNREKIRAR